ncbi:hypothetical protein [Neolewinella sp.]|uniref:hypothetical protein n=1 Tax=Neolewinella sp. TaxID=2993543 RepID=UPI003B52E9D4
MSNSRDGAAAFEDNTNRYIDRLNQQSLEVVSLIPTLPLPLELRTELAQTWRITRQKLAYFRRELDRSDGELLDELRILHAALLPRVMQYQVRLGEMMIADNCTDDSYLKRWNAIWQNFGMEC